MTIYGVEMNLSQFLGAGKGSKTVEILDPEGVNPLIKWKKKKKKKSRLQQYYSV